MRQLLRICSIGITWLLVSSAAFAACVEDRRPLVVGDNVVQLRAYTCGLGDQLDGPQVRVEIHRLSDVAASIILAKQSSEVLARVVGSATLIDNEVSKVYTDLLRQFGETVGGVLGTTTVEAGGSGGTGSIFDRKRQDPFRVLGAPGVYPAMEEIDALRRKIIPPGLKYFYAIDCFDDRSNVDTGVCQKYNSKPEMHFWRNMRPDDIANYVRRVADYNRRYKPDGWYDLIGVVPPALKLATHVTGNQWPEDFMIIEGTYEGHGEAFVFSYQPRMFMLDIVIIENGSGVPIEINDILGNRVSNTRLRNANSSSSGPANLAQPLGIAAGKLDPGVKVLVPLKIYLGPNRYVSKTFRYRQEASQVYGRIGANGYQGNIRGYGAPSFRSYAYGPEIVIGGLLVNGVPLNLPNRSANYLELTMSEEVGSCPYLLWQSPDGDWVRHGQILDEAPSKEREYTDARSFEGFKSRFRIEEREPEAAYIDQVELVITLDDGQTMTLSPDNPRLVARDGEYLRLIWGQAVDISFALPEDIRKDRVVESRFTATGYYRRYSSPTAQGGSVP